MQNPAEQLKTLPLTILVPDLLQQFNKPTLLGARDVQLNKAQMDDIAQALTAQDDLPERVNAVNQALYQIVQESVHLLDTRFGLSYEQTLRTTDISAVAEWETTADFLEIANHKSNAELRISAGCSLMAFLGDVRLAEHLLTVIRVDDGANDVDAMIARRALSHYSGVPMDTEDWLAQVRAYLSD
ncbi:MAG: hypothetical protein ACFE0Q_09140 [Anaerolineae bacterium]